MAEPYNFLQGTRAEYLARFALSKLGYAVPVPRESDRFLVDLFLYLLDETDGGLRPRGPTLAFQIKSSNRPIHLMDAALNLFTRELTIPFYIASVDVTRNKMNVFSTFNRIGHGYYPRLQKLILRLEARPRDFRNAHDSPIHTYHLGPPIASLDISKLDHRNTQATTRKHRAILETWSLLELWNLTWRQLGVPIIAHPPAYSSNRPLDLNRVALHSIHRRDLRRNAASFIMTAMDALGTYFQCDAPKGSEELIRTCRKCASAAQKWLSMQRQM